MKLKNYLKKSKYHYLLGSICMLLAIVLDLMSPFLTRRIIDDVILDGKKTVMIDAGSYDIGSYEFFKGFISGIHAGNYDITHFFIDNFYKLVNDKSPDALIDFINWLENFSESEHISFVLSITSDPDSAPDFLKKYII